MQPRPDRILDYLEYPVLYVDDEPENLRIFELAFRRDFTILTARSGEEGLALIHERPVSLVLSDHRMPGMTGVEFLTRVRDLDPKIVRVLVTAYGDAQTLQAAINDGSIYRFLPKPWTPDEVHLTLRRGIEVYALDRERGQLLQELTLLNRISRSINQELALGPLLDLLLRTVTGELGFDAAGILFFDAAGETLAWDRFGAERSTANEVLRDLRIARRDAPRFVQGLLDGDVQILSVDELQDLERPIRNWITEVAADQTLVVPLVGKKGSVGALCVDNRRGGRRFTGDDHTLLEGLANQAVIALENAQLVDDLRRSREQILRADCLGTLGTLAAGLAHEINNPLVSIQTFLSMAPAKRDQQDDEFWVDYHALACREVDRITRLVDSMRRLGRGTGDDARGETFDPGELAQEVVTLLQREADRARVSLHLEREPEVPKIVAVRDHIQQVLLNLTMNAIQASPDGGVVAVRVYRDRSEEGGIWLTVSDSGPGIPDADLDRIFDPFFTTKGPDQGTGLGLMICHRLVADHGGTIEVRSREGDGASFCVRLPTESDAAPGTPID